MIVMKFGGTSMGSVVGIRTAAGVVSSSKSSHPIVVLSAMNGVTDTLLDAGKRAISGAEAEVAGILSAIRYKHDTLITELIPKDPRAEALNLRLGLIFEEMQKVFSSVLCLRELSTRARDLIGSFGELLMVQIFAERLRQEGDQAEAIDGREFIITKEESISSLIDFPETKKRCQKLKKIVEDGCVPVLTGFICATPEGVTTTLGRGGSDYSASIVGHCLEADEIQIWTDVDGVMTADPRIVASAQALRQISYKEAAEMSYFGAKVLHPKTIMPAADLNIPLRIKNTFNPYDAGTLITTESPKTHQGVKAVTSITGVSLVSIECRGMIGVPGTAQRVFLTLTRQKINVLMFSQGSSDQHISLVVGGQDGESTIQALEREFEPEILKRQVDRIVRISDIAIIALVGEGMKVIPGIAGRAFGVIGDTAINILMIAEGSSDLNLSFVVDQKDAPTAVQLIHEAFELHAG